MAPKTKKCLKCNNCDAIHTSILNDSVSSCPSGIQQCAACLTVDKLKSEVEETIQRLKELLQNLRHAKTQMNQRHSAIFKKLPAEILYSVFESYVSADPALPRDGFGTFDESCRRKKMARPTVLSQICSQWRQVALATPRIWTTVVLVWDVSAEEEIDCVREWISRTRGFPLDIFIDTSWESLRRSDDWPCPFDAVRPSFFHLLQAIASTSAQWRYFTAHAPYCVLEYLGQHVKNLGLLEELNINRLFSSEVSPHRFWAGSQPAPKSVHLLECSECSPNKMNVQWNAVTTIWVARITTEECLTLLSSARELITCTIEEIRREDREERSWHINRPAIKHAKIQNFTYIEASWLYIFYRLKLPSLKSFTCMWDMWESFEESQDHDLFLGSMPNMNVLNISHISNLNAKTLQSALSKVPRTVAQLFLACDYYGGRESDPRPEILRVFNQATVTTGSDADTDANTDGGLSVVLPNLTSLEIRTDATKFPWKDVPKCFALPIEDNSAANQNAHRRRRRPLSRFRVTDPSMDKKAQVLIPADVLKELLVLQHNGAEIIFQREDGDDLLARSIVDAGLDKD
ncbi:hypothetical protein D9613_004511 [Agrocybe pediades]|uniref:F-box domain-containing protein n=1 Tax=Agrocybe pediades TaxID=84607 RepID=A0A8H4QIA9_9AGAR|nr:hypothetical protein D9613_004511 [Agrocybe pediades]